MSELPKPLTIEIPGIVLLAIDQLQGELDEARAANEHNSWAHKRALEDVAKALDERDAYRDQCEDLATQLERALSAYSTAAAEADRAGAAELTAAQVADNCPPGSRPVQVYSSVDTLTLGPNFTAVRACRHCGALITGGPTACVHCVEKRKERSAVIGSADPNPTSGEWRVVDSYSTGGGIADSWRALGPWRPTEKEARRDAEHGSMSGALVPGAGVAAEAGAWVARAILAKLPRCMALIDREPNIRCGNRAKFRIGSAEFLRCAEHAHDDALGDARSVVPWYDALLEAEHRAEGNDEVYCKADPGCVLHDRHTGPHCGTVSAAPKPPPPGPPAPPEPKNWKPVA